jgi:hypothetical protein
MAVRQLNNRYLQVTDRLAFLLLTYLSLHRYILPLASMERMNQWYSKN